MEESITSPSQFASAADTHLFLDPRIRIPLLLLSCSFGVLCSLYFSLLLRAKTEKHEHAACGVEKRLLSPKLPEIYTLSRQTAEQKQVQPKSPVSNTQAKQQHQTNASPVYAHITPTSRLLSLSSASLCSLSNLFRSMLLAILTCRKSNKNVKASSK